MNFYMNKQAVEIKTKFEHAPLSSPNEACAAIGMLCRIYSLPVPEKRNMVSEMRESLKKAIAGKPAPSEFAEKILSLLDEYYKDDPVTDEIYELLKYSYEQQRI